MLVVRNSSSYEKISSVMFFVSFVSISCTTRVLNHPITNVNCESIDSRIINFKVLGIDDTKFASISGYVDGKRFYQNDTLVDKLPSANVWVEDILTDSIYGIATNPDGEYNLEISPSKYNLNVQFVGFNVLKIDGIKIDSGEKIDISILLGQGCGQTLYKVNNDKTFTKINL